MKIAWKPRSQAQWKTFTSARLEAGRLWSDLVVRHARLRRLRWRWPSLARWQKWAKGKYTNLAAQSVQQIVGEFIDVVNATTKARKAGFPENKYPWRKPKYKDITYTNQSATIRDGVLRLPNGKNAALLLRFPRSIVLPGRLMEVVLTFGAALLVCKVADESILADSQVVPADSGHVDRASENLGEESHPCTVSRGESHERHFEIGVDLGVNTLVAATDGERAVLVSGRAVKADVQWRNKCLASLNQAMSGMTKGSRRWRRLRKRMHRVLDKARNRVTDACHKATRIVADTFPGASCYVGEPFNDAAQKMGRKQAQQVSQACGRRIVEQLDYKMRGAVTVNEAYSSQTCPVCGCRKKCRREYQCGQCGFQAPRDVVGCLNIRQIGTRGAMSPQADLQRPAMTWRHPVKYPGPKPGSSGGPPASSTSAAA